MLLRRKAKKGLSGAVTALILVIASVIIALVVVGFAFGLFGAFGGTPTVTQVGTGTLTSSGNYVVATITLHSTGSVQIVSATIAGTTYSATSLSQSLSAGVNTVTLSFDTSTGSVTLQPGSTYTISIGLSDGQTVQVAVVYQ
ncbi:DUF973 family protein [Sulfurisphaera ohwakuensis]|uniref:DUF973 family protein n=1 Tax=Sulfurisphaera ohwakuensis TaxID=69656 RepID=A0A650CD52_SULOH|nr:DUF973 family protein [Sulfurisphaera ohwakuensis]MBB5253638.1 hypothetical protein [Sulfurisphaera ohwakuensis]QGR15771.1 DUF973 family protein [Sulfurisphaera ohwakuensis]